MNMGFSLEFREKQVETLTKIFFKYTLREFIMNKNIYKFLSTFGASIVGVMTVLGIIASISGWTLKDWSQKSEMSYRIISETSFLKNPTQTETSVQLSISGQIYPEAYLYTIQIFNSGGTILSSQKSDSSAGEIPATFTFEGEIISAPNIRVVIGNHTPKLITSENQNSVQIISEGGFQPKEGVVFDVIVNKRGLQSTNYRSNKNNLNSMRQLSSINSDIQSTRNIFLSKGIKAVFTGEF